MKDSNIKEYELSLGNIKNANEVLSKMNLLNETIFNALSKKGDLNVIHDYVNLYHGYLADLGKFINYDVKEKSNEQKLEDRIQELVAENKELKKGFVDGEIDVLKIKNCINFFEGYIRDWWCDELSLGCISNIAIDKNGCLRINLLISLADFSSILKSFNFECNKQYKYQEYNLDICKFLGERLIEPTEKNKSILKNIVKEKFGDSIGVSVIETKGFVNIHLKQDKPKIHLSEVEIWVKDINALKDKINNKC